MDQTSRSKTAIPKEMRDTTATTHRRRPTSMPGALGGGGPNVEAFFHRLPEFFPLLRRHLLATSFPPPAWAVSMMMASESAEEDPAQRQQAQRLPERQHAPAKEWGQQPVPKMHDDFAADEDKQRNGHNRQRCNPIPSFSHIPPLI